MSNKKILIVSNCTWYLYNFRKELLNDLKKKGYDLILISPLDEYYLYISKLFSKKENLFLVEVLKIQFLKLLLYYTYFIFT